VVQSQKPEFAPTILEEHENPSRSKWRIGLVAALVLLALAAGLWWKNRPRVAAAQPPRAQVAPEPVQPQAASPGLPATNSDANSPAGLDEKRPLQQLVTGIWNVSSADSSTVIIDLQGEVQYEAHRLRQPERIYFDLHGTVLSHGLFGKTIEVGDPILARVRIAQPRKGVSRVVLETNGASNFSVSLQSNPYRLVVEIRKAAKADGNAGARDPGPREAGRGENDLLMPNPASQLTSPGRVGSAHDGQLQTNVAKFRLALDAGHGGWDLGTVGRTGLMEKDLVLDIVSRLGKMVESRLGAEVIYTRQDDTYLPLEKRTEIANLAQVDMFVSVHANYSNDSSARGAETYYTNTYSSVRARTEEADASLPENINWNNVDIREKVQQSRRFAVAVQQAMHRALVAQIPGMRNRGVKKASYVVLTGTAMPAILAEVSFVSSPADEDKLQSSSYRQSIAEALYKGIAQYAATTHHVNLASASSKPKGL
jgi:N-acetylmuramoyl-L-alanine amidase